MPIPLIEGVYSYELELTTSNGAIDRIYRWEWPDGYRTVGFRVRFSDGTRHSFRWLSEAKAALEAGDE